MIGISTTKSKYKGRRIIIVTTFILLLFHLSALGQSPQLIPVNAGSNQYPLTFVTADQNLIFAEFDGVVYGTNQPAHWTVTIGGTSYTPSGITGLNSARLNIVLPVAISYENRNDVYVSYDGGGDLRGVDFPPNNDVAPFNNIKAVNNHIIEESDFTSGLYGENPPIDLCAPVQDVEIEYNMSFSRRARNSIHYAAPRARIVWESPDVAGSQQFIIPLPEIGGTGSGQYRTTTSRNEDYPADTDNCTWSIAITPYVWTTGTLWPNLFAFSRAVNITLPNYKLDNGSPAPGTGEMIVFPEIGNPLTEFCVGEDIVDFVFEDNTLFDCRVEVESTRPNQQIRHVQFIYGTNAQPRIPNVYVDGVQVTDVNGDLIGGVPYEGPIVIYDPALTATHVSLPINHLGDFDTDIAGQRFEVTLKNWGPCNPWNFGLGTPVEQTSYLELIESPPAPTAASPTYCHEEALPLTASNPSPGADFRWYDDAALTSLVHTGTPFNHGHTAPGEYKYWVTSFFPVSGCEGPATEVTLTIRESLTVTGPISGPSPVCLDATGLVYSVPNDPATMPFGGPTEYVWTLPAGWTFVSGQGTRTITVNSGGTAGARTLSVVRQYTTAPECTSPQVSLPITVNPLSVGGSVTGGTTPICLGSSTGTMTLGGGYVGSIVRWERSIDGGAWQPIANTTTTHSEIPGTSGEYRYRGVVKSGQCSEAFSGFRTINVSPASVGGTLSGGTTPICIGSATGNMTLTGNVGTVVEWQRSYNGGAWTAIAGTTGLLTYSHTPTSAGEWRYRVRVQSNPCSVATSSIVTINVDPLSVGGSVSGGTTPICLGSQTGIMTLSGHTGSVVKWQRRLTTGSWEDIANTTTTHNDTPSSAGTWEYRAEVKSGSCGSLFSAVRSIVVTTPTVGGTLSGGTTPICYGIPTGNITLSGHTGSVIRWEKRLNGGGWSNIANTGTTYSEVPSESGTWDYRALVKNGVCADEYSDIRTIIVRPRFQLAQLGNNHGICSSASTTIRVTMTGGVGPYTVNYTANGVPRPQINGYVSGADINTGVLFSDTQYELTSVTDANGCPVESLGTPIDILVGAPPVSAEITGSGGGCVGISASLIVNIVGGAGPYEIIINGSVYSSNYTSGDDLDLGVLAAGPHSFTLNSVEDACGNFVPGAGITGSPYSITIDPIPTAAGTVNNEPTICNNGTTDIDLHSDIAGSNISWTVSSTPAVTWSPGKAPVDGSGGVGYTIAQNLEHDGTVPVTVTYSIQPVGPGASACPGAVITRNVVVNPTAQVNDPANQVVCDASSTNAVNFTTNRTGGTTTYSWVNSAPSIGLAANGTGNIGAFTATNNGTAPVTATITVTPTFTNGGESCTGPVETFTITVNPTAQVNDLSNLVFCSGSSSSVVTFATDRTGGTTTYAWTNSQPGIGLAASGSGNIGSFVTTNAGTAPLTATISVTPTFENGGEFCTGPVKTFTITVNPTAQVNDPGDQVVCNGAPVSAITFGTNRTGGTTTYSWTNSQPGIGLAASGSGNIASFNGINTGTAPITASITVTPTFSNGGENCTGTPETFTITVNPTAQVNDPADQALCNGAPVTAVNFSTNRTVGTTTYSWTNSNTTIGLAASGSGNIASFNAINNGSAPVIATISVTPTFTYGGESCTGTAEDFTITVNPAAQVNDPADMVVCNGAPTAVAFSTNRTGGITTYSWTNSNTGIGLVAAGTGDIPSFNATNTGTTPILATITVTPTFTNGASVCSGTPETFTITVNPSAQVNDPANQLLCDGAPSSLVTLSTNRTGGTTTYSWTNTNPGIGLAANGTGNIPSFVAENTGTAPVTATIVITPTFTNGGTSCDGPTESFTITINPTAQVNDPADQVVCNTASTSAVTFSTTRTGGTTSYAWVNNNTSIGLGASGNGNIPAFVGTNTGTAPVTATITVTPSFENGALICTGPPETFTITVNPTAQVNDPADMVVCNGGPTEVNFSTNRTGGTTTYDWTNNNTGIGLAASGTGNIPSFNATNTGNSPVTATVTVTPTFTNGLVSCVGPPESFTIIVNPTAQINTITDQVVCNGTSTAGVVFSTVRTGGLTTYAWVNDNTGIGLPAGGSGNIAAFDAINNGTSPVIATITVTPTFTNGSVSCIGPDESFTITVNPTAQVNDLSNMVVCNDAPVAAIGFSTNRSGGATSYEWTNTVPGIGLAASGTGDIPAFTAVNGGTAPLTATISVTPTFSNDGLNCTGPAKTFTITVNPTAQVNDPPDRVICNGAPVPAVNFITNRTGGTTTFSWVNDTPGIGLAAGGTGNIASFNAINTGNSPVVALITVTPEFTNGSVSCVGPPQTFTITVNPTAQVNTVGGQVLCNGGSTTAVSFSTTRTGGSATFAWTNSLPGIGLPASGSGDIASFVAVNNGTAPVTATITVTPSFENGGVICTGPTEAFTIVVNPTPTLSTPLAPAPVCSSTEFTYVPASATAGTSFSWSRADVAGIAPAGPVSGINGISETLVNITSATINVTYEYTLTANGCTNVQNVVVPVKPEPVISDQSVEVCSGAAVDHKIILDNFTNPGDNVTFTWPMPTLDPLLTGGSSRAVPSSANMNDVFVNTSGAGLSAYYMVTPYYNGCPGAPKQIIVTIGSEPVLDPNLDMDACSGLPTGLELKEDFGSVAASWYNITQIIVEGGLVPNGANSVVPATSVAFDYLSGHRFINTTGSAKTVTYRVIPFDGLACAGAPVDVVVTINPQPVVTAAAQAICSETVPTLTLTSNVPGSDFEWEVVDVDGVSGTVIGDTGTGDQFTATLVNLSHVIPGSVTYSVVGISPDGCHGTPELIVITVNPLPDSPAIIGEPVLCEGATGQLYEAGYSVGSTYDWTLSSGVGVKKPFGGNPGDSYIIYDFPVAGDHTIRVRETNMYSCSGDLIEFNVLVSAKPTAAVINGPAAVCEGAANVVFEVPLTAGSDYFWYVPSGAVITSGSEGPDNNIVTVTFGTNSGDIRVREVNVSGCSGPENTWFVTVNPLPAVYNVIGGGEYCEDGAGVGVGLDNSQVGVDYELFLNGSPLSVPLIVPGTGSAIDFGLHFEGSYTVYATSATSPTFCSRDMAGSVLVIENPKPIAEAVPANQPALCSGENIATITLGTLNAVPGTTYAWSRDFAMDVQGLESGTGNISGSMRNLTSAPIMVTFTILPTSGKGCVGAPIEAFVTINPEPEIDVNISSQTVCSDLAITDIEASVINGVNLGTIAWTRNQTASVTGIAASGTGSIVAGALRNLTSSAIDVTFTFTAESDLGCIGDPVTATVTVNPEPIAAATPSVQPVCSNIPISAIVLSTTNGVAGTSYNWSRDNFGVVDGIPENGTGNISGTLRNFTGAPVVVTFTIVPISGAGCEGDAIIAEVTVNPEPVAVASPGAVTACSNVAFGPVNLGTVNALAGTTFSWTRNNNSSATGMDASGNGDVIAGTLRNVTSDAVVVTFTITPVSSLGCQGDPILLEVTVNPEPVALASPSNQIVCSGTAISNIALSASNGVAGTTFSWTRDNFVLIPGIAENGNGNISGTLVNQTGSPVMVTFTITPESGAGCSGQPITAMVTVNPEPVGVATPAAQTICSNTAMEQILMSTSNGLSGTSYSWTRDETVAVTGIADSGSGNISGTMRNLTSAPIMVTFTITPTSGGCIGDPFTATVTVNPEPEIGVGVLSQTVCSDVAIADIEASVLNGVALGSVTWTRNQTGSVTGIADSGTGSIVAGALRNLTSAPVTVTFTFTAESNLGCVGVPVTATVTVNPEPIAAATPSAQEVCSNTPLSAIVLSAANGVAGTTYSWLRDNVGIVDGIPANGSGNISGTLRNFTGAPVVVTFTITPESGAGCEGDAITATVTVNPEPVALAAPDELTVCSNVAFGPVNLSTVNALAGTTFSWTRNNNTSATGMDASGNGDVIAGTLRNVTSDPVVVTFTITPVSNLGCQGDPITMEVTVNPEPVALAAPSNQTVCSGTAIANIALSASNGVAGTTYSWTRDNLALIPGIPESGAGDISGTLVNQTGSPVMVTFTITPQSGALCSGQPITAMVTVNPEPVGVATPASQAICSNSPMDQIVFSTSNGLFGTSYSWTRNETVAVTGIAASGSGNISGVPVNQTNGPVTATFTIIPVSGAGCTGPDFTASLTVRPEPVAEATPLTQTVCTGELIDEIVLGTSNGVAGTTFSWTRNNPSVTGTIGDSGNGNISGTLINTTNFPVTVTFEITPSYDGCPGATITAEVVVRPEVSIVSHPQPLIICNGGNATFSVTANEVDSYQWQLFNTGSSVWEDITGETGSSFTITGAGFGHDGNRYRVEMTGCNTVYSDEAILNIYPEPVVVIDAVDIEVCESNQAIFEVMATGSSLEYRWFTDRNDGMGLVEVVNTPGIYQGAATRQLTVVNTTGMAGHLFQLRITDMCGNIVFSSVVALSLSIDPVITTQPLSDEICEDGSTVFMTVVDGNPAEMIYQWQYMPSGGSSWMLVSGLGGYSGASTPELTVFDAAVSLSGNSYRMRVVNTRCGTEVISDVVTLIVNAKPTPSILPDPAAVSVENVLTLDGNPLGGSGTYSTHLWTGAVSHLDDVNVQSPIFTPSAMGDFQLTYRVTDDKGCWGEDVVTVTVTSGIVISMDDETVCADSDLQLTANPSGGSTVYVSHEWTGDGAGYLSDVAIRNPVFHSAVPGVYSLTYRVTDDYGTVGEETISVTVFERPVGLITGDGDFPRVCGGADLQLNGNPSGGSGTYTTHQWTGQTMPLSAGNIHNPVFNTMVPGNYTLRYRVIDSNGCSSDIVETVVTNEIPQAGFSSDALPGCTPMMVNFTNNSLDAVAYEWDFGDGSDVVTTTNPSHIFENLTTTIQYYTVTLTAFSENGCEHSITRVITVYPAVSSEFTVSDEATCSPGKITFGALPGALEYYWNFDDGTQGIAGPLVVHEFNNPTDNDMVFNVKLRTTSFYGCIDESEMEVLVYSTPRAEFSADPVNQVFPASTVNFTNLGSSDSSFDYLWDFGDGHTSSVQNPEHTYGDHGEYEVSFTVSNDNCVTTVTHKVIVRPAPPVSAFDEVAPLCAPMTVNFRNRSEYATGYRWDFGDGRMSIEENPMHTYHTPGTYLVRLIAYGDGGEDESNNFVTAFVSPVSYMNLAPSYVYVNDQHVAYFNLSHNADVYLWDFGDGNFSNEFEPIHIYTESGTYDVTLEVWTDDGCYDTFTREQAVEVEPAGVISYPTGFRPGNEPTGGRIDQGADEYERNKVFVPGLSEKVDDYHLSIHNRWGELLFESFEINVGWDGFVKGVKAKQDVYIWKVTGKYSDGEAFVMAGNITLLR